MPVEFGDLPPLPRHHRGGTVRWEAEAAELRSRPGEWARLTTMPNNSSATSFSSAINNGDRLAFRPAGTFEATTRGADVWVRYIGEATS
jgi:hypothetical protein